MNQKTAMQEIIDRADSGIKVNKAIIGSKMTTVEINRATHLLHVCERFKDLATRLLEKEKQQIIDAWDDGVHIGYTGDTGDADKYYIKTYKP